jgi:hypothetical protein
MLKVKNLVMGFTMCEDLLQFFFGIFLRYLVIIKKKNSEKQNADWSGHFIFRNALKKEEGKKKTL